MVDYSKYSELFYGIKKYGTAIDKNNIEEVAVDLMKYLPEYWQNAEDMKKIQKAFESALKKILELKNDVADQMHIESATWGLDLWENMYDVDTDADKTFAFRRERIKAKMRGSGTTTKQMIINVSSSFAGGEAKIIEYPGEYRFVIKFIGIKGVPANMADLTSSIEEIKPAHLAFSFEYTYNHWGVFKDKTWGGISMLSWEQIRTV